ncbi:MAG: tetratricopeptide repeat protein [Pyrinomonadaceae bacterium]
MRTYRHFVFLHLIFLTTVLRAQTLPALPPLVADNFAAPVRAQVVKAYAEASARPRDAEANGRLGMLLQTYEQYEAALVCFARARWLAPQDFRWTYYTGLVRATLGDHGQAILRFTDVVRQKPDFTTAHIRLADSLFALNRWEECGGLYAAVLAKDARNAHAHYGLGRVWVARRDSSAAIRHLLQAINLDPSFGAAHYALAIAYRDAGKIEQAKEHFALSQQHKGERPPLDDQLLDAVEALNVSAAEHLRRGVALDGAGNIEASITEHERALQADSQLVQAHLNLILLYHRANRFDKVEEHYRAAVNIDPRAAESHYNYGVALVARNEFNEAAQAFLRALQINPHYAEANHNYGVMLERKSPG